MQTNTQSKTPHFSTLSYRPDIDGLRAIAVLSVVIYHAVSWLLPGGFVGVDIFFVISGYLITSIVVSDTQTKGFSLLVFYERRIRRIVPALLLVALVTLICGFVFLTPGDYLELGESAIWTVGFVANFFFWLHTGYFDSARETMPLLHMWSLGVEEQFYLFWPILAVLCVRWIVNKAQVVWACLLLFFVSSFASSVHMTATDPQAAFYLPFTRIWELGLGAALALLPRDFLRSSLALRAATVLPWVGLALIIFGVTQLNSSMPFPGYNALFPVLGSALLIFSGGVKQTSIQRLLSTAPMVFVGKISYSLYLWHWPVFVFYRHYISGEDFILQEVGALIAFSVMLAIASWRWVEQPLRYARVSSRAVYSAGIGASIAVGLLGLMITMNNGFPDRVPEAAQKLADRAAVWAWACPDKHKFNEVTRPRCVLGQDWASANSRVVLWGDSHALHYAPLIDRVANRLGYSVFLFDSCPPYLDDEKVRRSRSNQPMYSQECGNEFKEMSAFFAQDQTVDLVLLASAWATYPKHLHGPDGERSEVIGLQLMSDGLTHVLKQVIGQDRRTLILTEIPRSNVNLVPCALSETGGVLRRPCSTDPTRLQISDVARVHSTTNAALHSVAEGMENVSIVDATARLCGPDDCETFINGEFIYRDTNHIRRNLEPETMDEIIRLIDIETAMSDAMQLTPNGPLASPTAVDNNI